MPPSAELVADKGYDSQALREWLEARGTQAVIPPRRNRKIQYDYDKAIYRQRNVIERMFCRLKDWRRIATRFDRNIKNFMSAVAQIGRAQSELQSLMRISYAVFCLTKKNKTHT